MRRIAIWAGGLALLLLGTALGIGLGYVSLVLPRQNELRRRDRPSPMLAAFRPRDRLESLAPGPVESLHEDVEQRGSRRSDRARSVLLRTTLPPTEQAALVEAFVASYKADLQAAGQYVAYESRHLEGGAGDIRAVHLFAYQGTFPGCLHVIGFGSGDVLTIQVEMHDDR